MLERRTILKVHLIVMVSGVLLLSACQKQTTPGALTPATSGNRLGANRVVNRGTVAFVLGGR
jgi:hypothetical protein